MSNLIRIKDKDKNDQITIFDLDKVFRIYEEIYEYNGVVYNSVVCYILPNTYTRFVKTVDEIYDEILIHQKKMKKDNTEVKNFEADIIIE